MRVLLGLTWSYFFPPQPPKTLGFRGHYPHTTQWPALPSQSQHSPSVPQEIMSLLLVTTVMAAHRCNIPIREEAGHKRYIVPWSAYGSNQSKEQDP